MTVEECRERCPFDFDLEHKLIYCGGCEVKELIDKGHSLGLGFLLYTNIKVINNLYYIFDIETDKPFGRRLYTLNGLDKLFKRISNPDVTTSRQEYLNPSYSVGFTCEEEKLFEVAEEMGFVTDDLFIFLGEDGTGGINYLTKGEAEELAAKLRIVGQARIHHHQVEMGLLS